MVREVGASFVYWSLSLEAQFYLLFPWVAVLFRKHLKMVLWIIILVQWCMQVLTPSAMLFVFRLDAICLGVLIALHEIKTCPYPHQKAEKGPRFAHGISGIVRQRLQTRGLGPAVLIIMVLAMGFAGSNWAFFNLKLFHWEHFNLRVALIAVMSASLVWIASQRNGWLMPPGKLQRALIWTGARSYAAYLIHIPVFFWLREIWFLFTGEHIFGGRMILPSTLMALGILAVLSHLNYRWVEQPLRRYGWRLSNRILDKISLNVPQAGGYEGASALFSEAGIAESEPCVRS